MKKKNPELTGKTFAIFAVILLVCMLASLKIGMVYQSKIDSYFSNSSVNFSVFTKQNIDSFCVQHGYQDGWAECNGIDFGVTCHREISGGYVKYDCFSLEGFYKFSGGASGGAGAGR